MSINIELAPEELADLRQFMKCDIDSLAVVEALREFLRIKQTRGRVAGLHPGAFEPAPDFDAPLPDEFWTGQP